MQEAALGLLLSGPVEGRDKSGDHIQEGAPINRLGKESVTPGSPAQFNLFWLPAGGYHDNRNGDEFGVTLDCRAACCPVEHRHVEVEKHEIGTHAPNKFEGFSEAEIESYYASTLHDPG